MAAFEIEQGYALNAALAYAKLGLFVIPVAPPPFDSKGGKAPLIPHDYRDGLKDPGKIRRWFSKYPNANVAIVTGTKSWLIVLDVDGKCDGFDSVNRLQSQLGPLPRTWTVETGGGGRHIYFVYPGFNLTKDTVDRLLGRGIALIGNGDYAVAPPSRHASGGRYRWAPGLSPEHLPMATFPRAWRGYLVGRSVPKALGSASISKPPSKTEPSSSSADSPMSAPTRDESGNSPIADVRFEPVQNQSARPSKVDQIAEPLPTIPRQGLKVS